MEGLVMLIQLREGFTINGKGLYTLRNVQKLGRVDETGECVHDRANRTVLISLGKRGKGS